MTSSLKTSSSVRHEGLWKNLILLIGAWDTRIVFYLPCIAWNAWESDHIRLCSRPTLNQYCVLLRDDLRHPMLIEDLLSLKSGESWIPSNLVINLMYLFCRFKSSLLWPKNRDACLLNPTLNYLSGIFFFIKKNSVPISTTIVVVWRATRKSGWIQMDVQVNLQPPPRTKYNI